MTLTVEDGTGYIDSDAYISLEDADTYHSSRGNEAWDEGDEETKETAIRRATTYIDGFYRGKFVGYRVNGRSQGLEWPRNEAYDTEGEWIANDELPVEIIQATAEAALRELATPRSLSPDINTGERITQQTVGPISTTYADSGSQRTQRTAIDEILRPLLINGGSMTQFLLRA